MEVFTIRYYAGLLLKLCFYHVSVATREIYEPARLVKAAWRSLFVKEIKWELISINLS